MLGYMEWTSKETRQTERANVTRCVAEQGVYHLEFSNTQLCSEGRLSIGWGSGEQHVKGMYTFTDNSYKGEAEVVGQVSQGKDVIDFSGTWHDPKDETGVWDVYVEFRKPTFSYDEHAT